MLLRENRFCLALGVYIIPSSFILFCFYSAAIRDQDFHSFQCGISASASRECYNHQRTEVGHSQRDKENHLQINLRTKMAIGSTRISVH